MQTYAQKSSVTRMYEKAIERHPDFKAFSFEVKGDKASGYYGFLTIPKNTELPEIFSKFWVEYEKITPVEKEEPLGVPHRSVSPKPCALVHYFASIMRSKSRKEVIEHCVANGVSYHTARTQYQKWYALNKKGGN